ncbi:MAG: hypothetical protein WBG61_15415, partial [Desulfobacterales bacterium]
MEPLVCLADFLAGARPNEQLKSARCVRLTEYKMCAINRIDLKGGTDNEQEEITVLWDRSLCAYFFRCSLLVFAADG